MPVKKKKSPEIRRKPVPEARVAKKAKKQDIGRGWSRAKVVYIGGDISLSSITLAGIAVTTENKIRVGAISKRWTKDIDYFIRLKDAANATGFVYDLLAELKLMAEMDELQFAIEEAVAIGYLQRAQSQWVKQQLQISGAFLGGLIKWGYNNIEEIQANKWRAMVAHDLGITTHKDKWGSTDFLALPPEFHPASKNVGKYRAQQWVQQFHPKWDGHWPDIVKTKDGQVPRPETSKAAGEQCDDRYEALAMAEWLRRDIKNAKV